MMSLSLEESSGKAFLKKKLLLLLRLSSKGCFINQMEWGHWKHARQMVMVWHERACCQKVGPGAEDQENMVWVEAGKVSGV